MWSNGTCFRWWKLSGSTTTSILVMDWRTWPWFSRVRIGFCAVGNRPGMRLLAVRPVPATLTNSKPNPPAVSMHESHHVAEWDVFWLVGVVRNDHGVGSGHELTSVALGECG